MEVLNCMEESMMKGPLPPEETEDGYASDVTQEVVNRSGRADDMPGGVGVTEDNDEEILGAPSPAACPPLSLSHPSADFDSLHQQPPPMARDMEEGEEELMPDPMPGVVDHDDEDGVVVNHHDDEEEESDIYIEPIELTTNNESVSETMNSVVGGGVGVNGDVGMGSMGDFSSLPDNINSINGHSNNQTNRDGPQIHTLHGNVVNGIGMNTHNIHSDYHYQQHQPTGQSQSQPNIDININGHSTISSSSNRDSVVTRAHNFQYPAEYEYESLQYPSSPYQSSPHQQHQHQHQHQNNISHNHHLQGDDPEDPASYRDLTMSNPSPNLNHSVPPPPPSLVHTDNNGMGGGGVESHSSSPGGDPHGVNQVPMTPDTRSSSQLMNPPPNVDTTAPSPSSSHHRKRRQEIACMSSSRDPFSPPIINLPKKKRLHTIFSTSFSNDAGIMGSAMNTIGPMNTIGTTNSMDGAMNSLGMGVDLDTNKMSCSPRPDSGIPPELSSSSSTSSNNNNNNNNNNMNGGHGNMFPVYPLNPNGNPASPGPGISGVPLGEHGPGHSPSRPGVGTAVGTVQRTNGGSGGGGGGGMMPPTVTPTRSTYPGDDMDGVGILSTMATTGAGVGAGTSNEHAPTHHHHHHHHHHTMDSIMSPPPLKITSSFPPLSQGPYPFTPPPGTTTTTGMPSTVPPNAPYSSAQTLGSSISSSCSSSSRGGVTTRATRASTRVAARMARNSMMGAPPPPIGATTFDAFDFHGTNGTNGMNGSNIKMEQSITTVAATGKRKKAPVTKTAPKPKKCKNRKRGWAKKTWEERFQELKNYVRSHGDANVPTISKEHPSLGHWVHDQRKQYRLFQTGRQTTMTEYRMQNLASVGFQWSLQKHSTMKSWDERLLELKEYKAKNGHTNVPIRWPENPSLGQWVSTQRQEYGNFQSGRKSNMTPARISALDNVGFVWSLRDTSKMAPRKTWDMHFMALQEFKAQNGHVDVRVRSKTQPSGSLGRWVEKQRGQYALWREGKSNKMTELQVKKLESIGFKWRIRDPSNVSV